MCLSQVPSLHSWYSSQNIYNRHPNSTTMRERYGVSFADSSPKTFTIVNRHHNNMSMRVRYGMSFVGTCCSSQYTFSTLNYTILSKILTINTSQFTCEGKLWGICVQFKAWIYCQTSDIKCTKFHHLNVSHLILQLSLPNPLEPGVKSRERLSLSAFWGTEDIGVHIVHISRVRVKLRMKM